MSVDTKNDAEVFQTLLKRLDWKVTKRPGQIKWDFVAERGGSRIVYESKSSKTKIKAGVPNISEWVELLRMFKPAPIKNSKELERATAVMNWILDIPKRSDGQEAFLEVISQLVSLYEKEHYPISKLAPREFLRESIVAKQVTQKQVSEDTGISEQVISNILNGRRDMTLEHVKTFARYFNYPVECFIDR